jgi:hypothetical protein
MGLLLLNPQLQWHTKLHQQWTLNIERLTEIQVPENKILRNLFRLKKDELSESLWHYGKLSDLYRWMCVNVRGYVNWK